MLSRRSRHALAAPAAKVRDRDLDVQNEMDLRLGKDPPVARPAPATVERTKDLVFEHGAYVRMGGRGPRFVVELPVQDLADQCLRQSETLVIPNIVAGCSHRRTPFAPWHNTKRTASWSRGEGPFNPSARRERTSPVPPRPVTPSHRRRQATQPQAS